MLLYFVVVRGLQETLEDSTCPINPHVVLWVAPLTLVTCNCASLPAGGSNESKTPNFSSKKKQKKNIYWLLPSWFFRRGVREYNDVMESDSLCLRFNGFTWVLKASQSSKHHNIYLWRFKKHALFQFQVIWFYCEFMYVNLSIQCQESYIIDQ